MNPNHMYKVIIIEDEPTASRRLVTMLSKCEINLKVIDILDSVEEAAKYLKVFTEYDLLFMDIQLGDGISFDIFEQVVIEKPIIFTTAYDEYALKAFKVNSIDYLLKPIDQEDLNQALDRFHAGQHREPKLDHEIISKMLSAPDYKHRFLVKRGQQFYVVDTGDVRYFYAEDGYTLMHTSAGNKHIVNYTIDQLGKCLDPKVFHRINRKMIISMDSITTIHEYFNSRLKLELSPQPTFDVVVSRDRVKGCKEWLSS